MVIRVEGLAPRMRTLACCHSRTVWSPSVGWEDSIFGLVSVPVVAMVGGAVVTEDYAEQIGADIYGADAVETVEKLKHIMESRRTA